MVAAAGGRAVATWTITGGQVVLAPFAALDAETQAALDTDAADVTRFLGFSGFPDGRAGQRAVRPGTPGRRG